MRNMSKKTRKKVMRIIKANCHSDDRVYWVPFKSSRMFAVWDDLWEDKYGFYGILKDECDFKYSNYVRIQYPEQLWNPRCPIDIAKQIVRRWEEGGFI